MSETAKTARLVAPDGRTMDLPVLEGTLGPAVMDVRRLYAESGMFT